MTTSRQYADSEGKFEHWRPTTTPCRKCGKPSVLMREWDSSDGAYTDYKFKCVTPGCDATWWVDGDDG